MIDIDKSLVLVYRWVKRVRASSFPPLIFSIAVAEGVQGKKTNENLLEFPEEQAEETREVSRAGASVVRVHPRDPQQWYDDSRNQVKHRLVNTLIRGKCHDITVNSTTCDGPGMSEEAALARIEARSLVTSLHLRPKLSKFVLKECNALLPDPRPETRVDECIPTAFGSP